MTTQAQGTSLTKAGMTWLQAAEAYVTGRFDHGPTYPYHNLQHTREVVEAARLIGAKEHLHEDQLLALELAAWFHDVGYLDQRQDHEAQSAALFRKFATDQGGISIEEDVVRLIKVTQMPQSPRQPDEMVICDADLYHLSTDLYKVKSDQLLHEMNEAKEESSMPEFDWLCKNQEFFEGHQYFTQYGKSVLEPRKQENLKQIKSMVKDASKGKKKVKKLETKVQELKEKVKEAKEIKPDRGIETMFRLTSRNHLALSAMADNKANIMISINSIILSIVVSVLLRKLEESPYLTIPTLILTLVCLLTIVFAILATRPNVSSGKFTKYDIINKQTNLLFFGNFHGVKLEDYEWGMKEMMKDADYLYSSLIKDIYFLGAVLGKKYRLLRISYTIFMFGFVVAVISFVLAFALHQPAL